MMKKPMWIFPLLVSMCMLISGCALRQMETMEMGDMTAPGNKMLIATQSTQFKKAVVSRITDALKGDFSHLKIIDVANLAEEPADAYDAIVILNACTAYHINKHVSIFLEKTGGEKNIILLTTAADGRREFQPEGVDAITSASRECNIDEISDWIISRVQAVLESER